MTLFQFHKITKIEASAFKWKHFSHEIILWAVRWYCQFALSYRGLVLMMEERGLSASHTTLMRWVHQYAPEIEKRVKRLFCTRTLFGIAA